MTRKQIFWCLGCLIVLGLVPYAVDFWLNETVVRLSRSLPRVACPHTETDPRVATVLMWNQGVLNQYMMPQEMGSCQLPRGTCAASGDETAIDQADAVLFNGPKLTWFPFPKKKCFHQRYVMVTQEHAAFYPEMSNEAFLAMFDLTMTYSRSSDIPFTYFDLLPGSLPPVERKTGLIAFIASNCEHETTGRTRFVEELMSEVQVDSYGQCLHNKDMPADDHRMRQDLKMATVAKYKFYIAFENAALDDYVTEKFFQGYQAGSVPVYRGARNIAEFAPAPHSYIDASDMTPVELGAYLSYLDRNDTAYEQYHAWRAAETRTDTWVNANWNSLHQVNRQSVWCRLCDRVLQWKQLHSQQDAVRHSLRD